MIGTALKYMRKQKNYKQDDLAKKVNMSQQNLSRYEKEQRIVSFDIIEKIAEECDYNIFFENKKTGEKFTTKNINRKDI